MSYTITGLTSGAQSTRCGWRGSTRDSRTVFTDNDERERTAEATAIVGAPGVPTDVSVVSGEGTITVSWSPPEHGADRHRIPGALEVRHRGLSQFDRSTTLNADARSTVLNRAPPGLAHHPGVGCGGHGDRTWRRKRPAEPVLPGPPGSVDARRAVRVR